MWPAAAVARADADAAAAAAGAAAEEADLSSIYTWRENAREREVPETVSERDRTDRCMLCDTSWTKGYKEKEKSRQFTTSQ